MSAHVWRVFDTREVHEATAWADDGNVAVHLNFETWLFKGWRTAHLWAQNEGYLRDAARACGVDPKWIQGGSRQHYDLFASPLRRALQLCGLTEREAEEVVNAGRSKAG